MSTALKAMLISATLLAGACIPAALAAQPTTPPATQQVWCSYMPWMSLHETNRLFLEMYDVPLAHPSGNRLQDLRSEMMEASRNGIDVLLEDLPRLEAFVQHLDTMLKAAHGTPMKIGILLDGVATGDTPEGYAKKAGEILKKIGSDPALARVDGKPLMTTFWAWRWPPEFWKEFRARLRQDYGVEIFLIGDPNTQWDRPATMAELSTYAGCFDQLYEFSETTERGGHQSLADTYRIIAQAAKTRGIADGWTGAIAPGYNGGWYLRGRNDYYSPFMGFDRFWEMWQLSIANGAAHMQLTTWNDMDERWFQPSVFQFHSYLELNQFWVNQWRGRPDVAPTPRVYLAYQREQMLGTLQRIEVVSLPTSAAGTIVIEGEIQDARGNVLLKLPSLTVPANEAARREWWVPTANLGATPAAEPVIRIKAGDTETVRHMPLFRLRTGWIANQIVIKAPVHEMAEGTAALNIRKTNDRTIEARVSVQSSSAIRHVTLWRDDRPIGSFAKVKDNGTVYGLLWETSRAHRQTVSIAHGKITQAYQTGASDTALPWKPEGFTASVRPIDYLAALVHADDGCELQIAVNGQPAKTITIAGLLKDDITIPAADGTAVGRIRLAPIDPLAAIPAAIDERDADLSLLLNVDQCLPSDLFYVRCETADGRFFYSPAVTPFSSGTVRTNVLQTSVSLDQGGLRVPPIDEEKVLTAEVSTASLQRGRWALQDPSNADTSTRKVVTNTLGREQLHLGSGGPYYKTVPDRVPATMTLPDGGLALAFDGVNDIAELPCRQIPIGSFTVQLKICPHGPINKPQTVLGHTGWMSCPVVRLLADGTVEAGRDIRALDDAMQPVSSKGKTILARSDRPLRPDEWATIRVTFDESTVRLYVDGRLAGQATGTPGRVYGNNRVYIGGPADPFRGLIGSVEIASYADDASR